MEQKISKFMIRKSTKLAFAFSRVFQTEDGKVVLDHLSRNFWLGKSTFADGKPDLSAFREGERNVLIYILKMSKVDPVEMSNRLEKFIKDEEKESSNENETKEIPPWLK